MLNSLRMGTTSQAAFAAFKGLSRPLSMTGGILPTELFSLRKEVDEANRVRLDALKVTSQTYESRDTGNATDDRRGKILESMAAQKTLEIKVGAQVMLIKNVDENLVNGSIGRVLGYYMVSEVWSSNGENSFKGDSGFVREVLVGEDGETPAGKGGPEGENETSGPKPKQKNGSRSTEEFPLVEFLMPSGKEVVLVGRDEFKVEDSNGTVAARRVQVS